jgi:hypothetical protein
LEALELRGLYPRPPRSLAPSLRPRTVGQWAPTLLILGLYNTLVKQLGHDRVAGWTSEAAFE